MGCYRQGYPPIGEDRGLIMQMTSLALIRKFQIYWFKFYSWERLKPQLGYVLSLSGVYLSTGTRVWGLLFLFNRTVIINYVFRMGKKRHKAAERGLPNQADLALESIPLTVMENFTIHIDRFHFISLETVFSRSGGAKT